jgi:hypothetical protein
MKSQNRWNRIHQKQQRKQFEKEMKGMVIHGTSSKSRKRK